MEKGRAFTYNYYGFVGVYALFALFFAWSVISQDAIRGLFIACVLALPFILMRKSPYASLFFFMVPFLILYSLIAYLSMFLIVQGTFNHAYYAMSMAGAALLLGIWIAYLLKELSCSYGRFVIGALYAQALMFLLMLSVLITIKSVMLDGGAGLPGPIYLGLMLFLAPFLWFARSFKAVCVKRAKTKSRR